MQKNNPLLPLHEALGAALMRDMSDIEYETTDWGAARKLRNTLSQAEYVELQNTNRLPTANKVRRPGANEVDVILFPQTWGSTALGYGGIGGAAMSEAYTIVVATRGEACVYFGGGSLAYRVDFTQMTAEQRNAWETALSSRNLPGRMEAVTRLGALA